MSKKGTEEESVETPEALKEDDDHAANEAAVETPVPVEGRRDGNGALIVN